MKKRTIIAVVLAVLMAASAYAQTRDFFDLVCVGTPQEVQTAITQGADVNAQNSSGYTPLILAAGYNKNPEVITALLNAGADLNARDAREGAAALIWAAAYNKNPEVISTLLKAGADIKATTQDGSTALMMAVLYSPNPEVIIVLLNAGADTKVKDNIGRTALDYAKGNRGLKDTDALKQLEEASK